MAARTVLREAASALAAADRRTSSTARPSAEFASATQRARSPAPLRDGPRSFALRNRSDASYRRQHRIVRFEDLFLRIPRREIIFVNRLRGERAAPPSSTQSIAMLMRCPVRVRPIHGITNSTAMISPGMMNAPRLRARPGTTSKTGTETEVPLGPRGVVRSSPGRPAR